MYTQKTKEEILERDRCNHGKLIQFSEWAYKHLYFENRKDAELATYDSIMAADYDHSMHKHYIDGISFNKLAKEGGLSLKAYNAEIRKKIHLEARNIMIETYGWRFGSFGGSFSENDCLDVGKYNTWARRSDALAYVNDKKCIFLRKYDITIYILILFRMMQINNIRVHLRYGSELISLEDYLCEYCSEYNLDYIKKVFCIINTEYYILKSKDHDDMTIRYIDKIDDFIMDKRLTNFNLKFILSEWLLSYNDIVFEAANILKPYFMIATQDKDSIISEYELIKILEEI